ncbi:MAG: hypothetical protein AAF394_13035 [Planctomycetota bacterium]
MYRRFTALIGLIALCGCSQPEVVGELAVGMTSDAALAELKEVGAVEVSFDAEEEADGSQTLWRIDRPKMALATTFKGGKLSSMYLWRWEEAPTSPEQSEGRESISSVSIFPATDGIEATLVKD